MSSILVICIGNICRSPIAERVLRRDVLGLKIRSAGLNAVIGHGIQSNMAALAQQDGIDTQGHSATQFTTAMGIEYDLILVMEQSHKTTIAQLAPQLQSRCLLFDH